MELTFNLRFHLQLAVVGGLRELLKQLLHLMLEFLLLLVVASLCMLHVVHAQDVMIDIVEERCANAV